MENINLIDSLLDRCQCLAFAQSEINRLYELAKPLYKKRLENASAFPSGDVIDRDDIACEFLGPFLSYQYTENAVYYERIRMAGLRRVGVFLSKRLLEE